MSLAWLFPAGFAALGALLVPLLIHLARRDQRSPLDFAALRWLRADPRPRRRLRFDEPWLLASRLLLLALIAVWLAQPAVYGADDRSPYVAVMPGVPAADIPRQGLPADARRHWLATGFAALDAPAPIGPQPTSSLLREIDARLPAGARLVVLATPAFDGTDAQRPRLSRQIDWRIVGERDGTPLATTAVSQSAAAPRLVLPEDTAHAAALRYLRAVQRAWQSKDEAPRVHVALQAGPIPASLRRRLEAGGTALLGADVAVPTGVALSTVWRDEAGLPLMEAGALGRGRLLRFTRALQAQAMPQLLEPGFPQRLRELLQAPPPEPARVDARAFAARAGARAYPTAPRGLQSWLALAIALLFALERLLATRAARGGAVA